MIACIIVVGNPRQSAGPDRLYNNGRWYDLVLTYFVAQVDVVTVVAGNHEHKLRTVHIRVLHVGHFHLIL